MKIALVGGSFNPPHQGHLDVLKWLVGKCPVGFHEVWVLPTVTHAFEEKSDLLPYEVRERMVTAMLYDEFKPPGLFGLRPDLALRKMFKVVRREETRTIELLEALRSENPGDEFYPVLGADILLESDRWERWDEVLKAPPVFVSRASVTTPEGYEVHDIGAADVSSTDIRRRLAEGDLTYLIGKGADVPLAVITIIEQENLYGYKPIEIEQKVWLDTVHIRVPSIIGKIDPGTVFCLRGNVSRVLGVVTQNHTYQDATNPVYCFAFRVLRDTQVDRDNQADIRLWWTCKTEARTAGEGFATPKPEPEGPGMCYLKIGGEPLKDCSPGALLGQADDFVFFSRNAKGVGSNVNDQIANLFGDIFGG